MKSSKCRIRRSSPMTVYSNFIHNFGPRYINQQLWLMPLHFWKYKRELCKRAKHNCPKFFLTGECCFYKIVLGWEVSSQDKHTNPNVVAQPWRSFPLISAFCFLSLQPSFLQAFGFCWLLHPSTQTLLQRGAGVLQSTERGLAQMCTLQETIIHANPCSKQIPQQCILSQAKQTVWIHWRMVKPAFKEFALVAAWISPSPSNNSLPTPKTNQPLTEPINQKWKPKLWEEAKILLQ